MLTTAAALALLALPVIVLGPRAGLEIINPMAQVALGGVVTAVAVAMLLVPGLVTMGGRRAEGVTGPAEESPAQVGEPSVPASGSSS